MSLCRGTSLDLIFQSFVKDKGCCTLLCNCFLLKLGHYCQGPGRPGGITVREQSYLLDWSTSALRKSPPFWLCRTTRVWDCVDLYWSSLCSEADFWSVCLLSDTLPRQRDQGQKLKNIKETFIRKLHLRTRQQLGTLRLLVDSRTYLGPFDLRE